MCVERDPEACQRALVAEALQTRFGMPVLQLLPL
jgi:hypothetical protein